jgi:hypothetical protein
MADSSGEEFVALGEYTLDADMLRIRITGVRDRDTLLPKLVVDKLGRVLCRTIWKAYETKSEVLWYERDMVVPNEDGCTYSSL